MDLKKLGCKFLDTIEVPRKDFFISEYEQKFKPCVIKNYPLNWKAFTWTDEYVAKAIGHEYYLDYLNRETPYLKEEEQGSHPTDTSIYLQDMDLSANPPDPDSWIQDHGWIQDRLRDIYLDLYNYQL